MEKQLTCISCPVGCQLTVIMNENEIQTVSGNQCRLGAKYALSELTNPVRMVTTSLRVQSGAIPVVPVKTDAPIPKGKIFSCLKELKNIELQPPIKIGDIIVENVSDTGVNIIATRDVGKKDSHSIGG